MQKSISFLKELLNINDTVVIGVSGGPDSMCLLSLLGELKNILNLRIVVCHVNHNVREQSLLEEEYVKQYCLDNKYIFEYLKLGKLKGNFEAEARKKRYEFFDTIVKKYNAKYLMTAHHGDDLVESVLMKIIRGSNLSGYKGFSMIKEYNGYKIVRPLLYYTKEDIEKYLDNKKIKYYIDETNMLDEHLRNRIRHNILPSLKNENKMVHNKFLEFSKEIEETDNYLQNFTNKLLDKMYINNVLDLKLFNEEDEFIKLRIIGEILHRIYKEDLYLIRDNNCYEIKKLIDSCKPNGIVMLPNNIKLVKAYDKLYVSENVVVDNNRYELEDVNIINNQVIEKLDKSSDTSNYVTKINSCDVKLPLYIRTRKDGDKVSIKNFNGTKKLKDILIDSKINKEFRDKLLLVVDSNDEIIWIPGIKKTKFDKDFNEKYDIILKYRYEGEIDGEKIIR